MLTLGLLSLSFFYLISYPWSRNQSSHFKVYIICISIWNKSKINLKDKRNKTVDFLTNYFNKIHDFKQYRWFKLTYKLANIDDTADLGKRNYWKKTHLNKTADLNNTADKSISVDLNKTADQNNTANKSKSVGLKNSSFNQNNG